MTTPQKWSVGTSSSLFGRLEEAHLVACKDAGVTAVEFVVSRNDPERGARYAPLAKQAADLGIDIWSIHLPFGVPWDISSLDPDIRQASIEGNIEIMERTVAWGPKKMILHPSYEPIADEERAERMKHCTESLHALGEAADRLGVQIAVECLPRTCLGNTSEEIITLLQAHSNLGVCCDVNHLLHETPQHFIANVGSKIATLHISDYDAVDERHWLPGRGVIDWTAVITELLRAGYEGPFMYEVSNRNLADDERITPQVLMDCWQGLREAYEREGAGASS